MREADIVTCATTSRVPLVRGAWLRPGTHVDLVGGFTPQMREADDEALRRARVFVDSGHACHEAGDLTQTGITPLADLRAFAAEKGGRQSEHEITLFKSVGMAIEDLAAAILVVSRPAA